MKPNNQIINDVNQLMQTVTKFYLAYLDELEQFIQQVPEDQPEVIAGLQRQIDDIQEAIVHDLEVFERAAQDDVESLHHLQDQLKINNIYQKLGY